MARLPVAFLAVLGNLGCICCAAWTDWFALPTPECSDGGMCRFSQFVERIGDPDWLSPGIAHIFDHAEYVIGHPWNYGLRFMCVTILQHGLVECLNISEL